MSVSPLATPIQVRPSQDRAPASVGVSRPMFTTTVDGGDEVVFKHNGGGADWIQPLPLVSRIVDGIGNKKDRGEILSSRIMQDELGLPSLTYRPAFYVDERGETRKGLVSDRRSDFRTLTTAGVDAIADPQLAVSQQVARAWLGDWDCIDNDNNTWVLNNGTTLAVDYGESWNDGVTTLGLPDASRKILAKYGTPERIQPMLDRICSLSNDDIRAMVDRVGSRYVPDWTQKDLDRYAGMLCRNRDRLMQKQPFSPGPVRQWLAQNETGRKVTEWFIYGPGTPIRLGATAACQTVAKALHLPPYRSQHYTVRQDGQQ